MNDFDWIHDIEAYQSLLTDNLDESNLVVIGAPCAGGKTWVLVNIGLRYRTNEKNVLHIIMGESVQSLATKYKMSGFNDIMDNKGKLIVKNYPYGDTMTIDDVVDYIRRANEGTKFDIVMIDNPYELCGRLDNTGRKLWELSNELGIPIVITHNTIRRPNYEGVMTYSINNQVLYNADKVVLMTFNSEDRRLNINIMKNRHGPDGINETHYFNEDMRLWL